ncbi:unnamed protein product [Camellia sinensis]
MMPGDVFSIPTSIKGFSQDSDPNPNPKSNTIAAKKKRNLPGTPGMHITDPDAEVIALSPKTLMATNRFVCEICNKGFQRDQNLQLHRRGHNLPWKLKQRSNKEVVKKKVYICPETTCVHHHASRALGDLTGIKKHLLGKIDDSPQAICFRNMVRRSGSVRSVQKNTQFNRIGKLIRRLVGLESINAIVAHSFPDSFITHRAFCDALAMESARLTPVPATHMTFTTEPLDENVNNNLTHQPNLQSGIDAGISQFGAGFRPNYGSEAAGKPGLSLWLDQENPQLNTIDMSTNSNLFVSSGSANMFGSSSTMSNFGNCNNWIDKNATTSKSADLSLSGGVNSQTHQSNSPGVVPMSATALLQKAAQMGSTRSNPNHNPSFLGNNFGVMNMNMNMNSPSSSDTSPFNHRVVPKPAEILVSAANLATVCGGGVMGSSSLSSLVSTSSNFEQIMMQSGVNSMLPLKLNPGSNVFENSLTRDFLGVGGEGGRSFLPQELAKFASMSSAMGLSHFMTSNH